MFAREIDKDTMIKDSIDWHLVSKDGFPTESGVYYVMRVNPYRGCSAIGITEENWYNDKQCFHCAHLATKKEIAAQREKDSYTIFAWAPFSITAELMDEAIEALKRRDAYLDEEELEKV